MIQSRVSSLALIWLVLIMVSCAPGGILDSQERPIQISHVRQGKSYQGSKGLLEFKTPIPNNRFVRIWRVREILTNDQNNEKIEFAIRDFGNYIVVGAKKLSQNTVDLMSRDDPKTVLRNVSKAILFGWRKIFPYEPTVKSEKFLDTKFGPGLLTVFYAKKGSFLARSEVRYPTRDDTVDAYIGVITTIKGNRVVFAIYHEDYLGELSIELSTKAALSRITLNEFNFSE